MIAIVKNKQKKVSDLLIEAQCYIAKHGDKVYNNLLYGSCNPNQKDLMVLQLLLFSLEGNCKINLDIIYSKIAEIIGYCKPVNKRCLYITIDNDDYADWYNSQEYLDCLQVELEENGWINPMIDICKTLNISINDKALCGLITGVLSSSKIDCNVIASINPKTLCNLFIKEIESIAKCELKEKLETNTVCSVDINLNSINTCVSNTVLEVIKTCKIK